jgi:uncharacterized membrane-anchored protein
MSENLTEQTTRESVWPAWLERLMSRLTSREHLILLLAVGFQVIVLLSMIALRATPLLTGSTILVRVVPIDPRDFFRGDYVVLGYEFSRIPPEGIDGLPKERSRSNASQWLGKDVYVTLVPDPDGQHWQTETMSLQRPSEGTYIRGTVTDFGRLEFGIEAYYVQEGEGKKYEEAIRTHQLSAELAVTKDGQAVLRGLRIE